MERENFCRCCSRAHKRARKQTEGNRCDEGVGALKIIGCIASRVVRLFVYVGWKDKLLYTTITVQMSKEMDVLTQPRLTNLTVIVIYIYIYIQMRLTCIREKKTSIPKCNLLFVVKDNRKENFSGVIQYVLIQAHGNIICYSMSDAIMKSNGVVTEKNGSRRIIIYNMR